MSLNLGSKSGKQTTNQWQTSQSDPWDVVQPHLEKFLSTLPTGPTGTYQQTLTPSAQAQGVVGGLYDSTSRAPEMGDAYNTLNDRLSPVANGTNVDIHNNPYIQTMLQQNADDVANRINSQFAGAGRDLSGYNQRAIGEGVSRVTIPALADLYKYEQGRTDSAARDLFGAKGSELTTADTLDRSAADRRLKAVETEQALKQQMATAPYDELDRIAQLLFGAAGLGGQTQGQGTSVTKSKQSDVGFKANLAPAISTIFKPA